MKSIYFRFLRSLLTHLPANEIGKALSDRLRHDNCQDAQRVFDALSENLASYAQSNEAPWQMVSLLADKIGEWGYLSFSQSGEDAVLRNFLRNKRSGFYVDVGANHPIRFSNTYYYYLRGWRGINIEPMAGSKAIFDNYRPRDINLEVAVGKPGTSTLFIFEETCFNTMDDVLAAKLIEDKISPLKEKRTMTKVPLAEILATHCHGASIDFLSVDAEGLDEEVLASNDWDRFRPCYVAAERHANDPSRPMDPRSILQCSGYSIVAQTEFSEIYRDTTSTSGFQ